VSPGKTKVAAATMPQSQMNTRPKMSIKFRNEGRRENFSIIRFATKP
jgi:hypothetical protein